MSFIILPCVQIINKSLIKKYTVDVFVEVVADKHVPVYFVYPLPARVSRVSPFIAFRIHRRWYSTCSCSHGLYYSVTEMPTSHTQGLQLWRAKWKNFERLISQKLGHVIINSIGKGLLVGLF